MGLFVDGLEEFLAGFLELHASLIIALGRGNCIQLLQSEARPKVTFILRQRSKLFVGRHHVLVAVFLANLAFRVLLLVSKEAGPVIIDVGR